MKDWYKDYIDFYQEFDSIKNTDHYASFYKCIFCGREVYYKKGIEYYDDNIVCYNCIGIHSVASH